MNLISIENLYLSYGAKSVLHGVDLEVDTGEVVTIVGPMDQARQVSCAQ